MRTVEGSQAINNTLRTMSPTELSDLATAAFDILADNGEVIALSRLTAAAGRAIGSAFPAPRSSGLPASPSAAHVPTSKQHREFPLTMYGINESTPGPQWQALFDATWPAYRTWYTSPDGRPRPRLDVAQDELATYMPELMPTYNRLVSLTNNDAVAAKMLTMWDPPRFLPGCSQLAVVSPEPLLCRNYDYSPELFEAVSYSSHFNKRVVGTSDCLWGLLDGMNDSGLVVSLAFGGESGAGPGFGIPLVVRYLLEVADTTAQARAVLERVPVNMAYNLTIMDARGETTTAFVSPHAAPEFFNVSAATNHRGNHPTDPIHARTFRSVERRNHLDGIATGGRSAEEIAAEFLSPALRSTNFSGAFGTVYTALYRPTLGAVEYHWPDQIWRRTFDSPSESIGVTLVGR